MTFDEWWESQGRPRKEQLQFESLEAYEIANDAWIAATWEARDPVPHTPGVVEFRAGTVPGLRVEMELGKPCVLSVPLGLAAPAREPAK